MIFVQESNEWSLEYNTKKIDEEGKQIKPLLRITKKGYFCRQNGNLDKAKSRNNDIKNSKNGL